VFVDLHKQSLMRNHVPFNEQHTKLFLECSKTDVYREGWDALNFETDNSTCLVNMLSRYKLYETRNFIFLSF
jgi:hypothetical protein